VLPADPSRAEPFASFFERATGVAPYRYQRELGECTAPPSVLAVPTGAGKTHAILAAWLYQRLVRGAAPRKLVYALPMRTLVEQTEREAHALVARLNADVAVLRLMGGELERAWLEEVERPLILVGTVDVLLSRALNRGYGEPPFAWPVSFGALNSDCRWVFDEIQLMGPARATSAQLDGLRKKLGVLAACETLWASATVDEHALTTFDRPQVGDVVELPDEDRTGALAPRLGAVKVLRRVEADSPRRLAEQILAAHEPGTRTLAVLNRVDRAQELWRSLRRQREAPPVVLLHSRFRPGDRAARLREVQETPGPEGTIVVATQVIEAGVDLSSRLLVTDVAPFSSVIQRLGRLNRAGEHPQADVWWLDRGEPSRADAHPYLVEDLAASRAALLDLEGASLSPERLRELVVAERADTPIVLRRRDLLDLFDTTPDLAGADIDVSPFIREPERRTVSAFFRETLAADAQAPSREELVDVPIADLGRRERRIFDRVGGAWVVPDVLVPGMQVMLTAGDGGYAPDAGWDPKLREPVDVLPSERDTPEALGDDRQDTPGRWALLGDHLAQVAAEAERLARGTGFAAVLREAGALHDVGKAHPVFQATLRSAGDAPDGLLAKSPHRRPHQRPFFRHELASALSVLAAGRDPLVAYLVAAHHGRVRLAIRPARDETPDPEGPRRALGIEDGDELPEVETPAGRVPATTIDLSPMELGAPRSWTDLATRLRDDPRLGPFRLGALESLLRLADWRVSARA